MPVTPVEPFVIDHESMADDYLTDLLKHHEYRSMDVVEQRANKYIRDAALRSYFLTKARELLATY